MKLDTIWSPDLNKSHYLAFVIDEDARTKLFNLIKPMYERRICHHVTLRFDISNGLSDKEREWLGKSIKVNVIGVLTDDKGVQCLPVSVEGDTDRPDGSFYHITHSLAVDRKPVESNRLDPKNMHYIKGIVPVSGKVYLLKK